MVGKILYRLRYDAYLVTSLSFLFVKDAVTCSLIRAETYIVELYLIKAVCYTFIRDSKQIIPIFRLVRVNPGISAVIRIHRSVLIGKAPLRLNLAYIRVSHRNNTRNGVNAVLLEFLHKPGHVLNYRFHASKFIQYAHALHIIGDLAVIVLDIYDDCIKLRVIHAVPEL